MRFGGDCQYRPVPMDEENIAAKMSRRYSELYPELYQNAGNYLKTQLSEIFLSQAVHIRESLAVDDAAIFLDYIGWAIVRLDSLSIPRVNLERSLVVLNDVLQKELAEEAGARAAGYISLARARLPLPPAEVPSYIRNDNPHATDARAYLAALISSDREGARILLMRLLDKKVSAGDLYRHVFEPILQETGRLWQIRQLSIAQEHYITAATQLFVTLLNDRIREEMQQRKNRYIITACISDEYHDFGIRMVSDFFEMDGWDTLYTGANTPARSVIKMMRDHHADAIAISCTMASHLPRVFELIQGIRADPVISGTCIIVGGYPFTLMPDLWQCMGADAGASTADEAVEKVDRFLSR